MSLDKESTSPAYRLGRLFAVLESAQRQALGGQVNATIRDRYYGAASATPASVFPCCCAMRKIIWGACAGPAGRRRWAGKDIREIVDGLTDSFPRSLRIEDQGRFAIGYYHQSQSRFNKMDRSDDSTDSTEDTSEEASA